MAGNKRKNPETIDQSVVLASSLHVPTAGIYNNVSSSTVVQNLHHRSYVSAVTPGFKNAKILPWNPYSMVSTNTSSTTKMYDRDIIYKTQPEYNGYSRSQTLWHEGVVDLTKSQFFLAEAEALCSSRTAKQFNNISINLGVAFGERQQTINLIENTAKRIVHAARAVKRLRFGDAARALGMRGFTLKDEKQLIRIARKATTGLHPAKRPQGYLASTWLELQYGWKPLLNDVYGAAELLGSRLRSDTFSQRTYSSATVTKTETLDVMYSGLIAKNAHVLYRQSTCKYYTEFTTSNEVRQAFAVTGLSNPLLIAWELVPFSFVVDWFLPVGNFVEQLSAYDGFNVVNVRRVRFHRGSSQASWASTKFSGSDPAYKDVWKGDGEHNIVSHYRDTIARPAFVPLSFKNPISASHAMSALSLLQVIFGR